MSETRERGSGHQHDRADDWRRIEAEAAAMTTEHLRERERMPLEFGQTIAWVDCRFGRTNGFSSVHRVGFSEHQTPFTTCRLRIPHPVLWVVANQPRFLANLGQCGFCAAEFARIERENAA